jgi:dTDP-4-dehydrorhamnose 3,5-epimerase
LPLEKSRHLEIRTLDIEGPLVIQPKVFFDDRGYFFETFNEEVFSQYGLPTHFRQDNQSLSQKGALRGLHFQAPPYAQGKLVRVIMGAVYDVIVDIRKGSPTYGKHYGLELTGENFTMFWIPEGFAHGFSTLADNTIFSYKCTNVYNRSSEGGILWNDPDLSIDWRINDPVLSQKDRLNPGFADFNSPF